MRKKAIYTDGGLENFTLFGGKPRGRAYAKINFSKDKREVVFLDSYTNTSQEAELFAMFCALCFAIEKKIKTIYSDSEWAVKLVNGEYRAHDPRFQLMVSSLKAIIKRLKIRVEWVRREDNFAT